MNAVELEIFEETVKLHKDALAKKSQEGMALAEHRYNKILNRAPFDVHLSYVMAAMYIDKGWNGVALNLLFNLIQNDPKNSDAYNLLGAAFRNENQVDHAKAAWTKCIQMGGENPVICNNMATLYADSGQPREALEWVEKALKLDPQDVTAHWEKALALLSLRQWDEGWKHYEWRQKLPSWDGRPGIDAPQWDGSYVNSLYIHGEQGVGDEVMFASCLPFVRSKNITVEVNKKVATLIQKSFPHVDVVTEGDGGAYDAKVPIGSLMGRFGFNREPYLNPDPWRVDYYREELSKLGAGPYVALTWLGGVKQTRVEDRSFELKDWKPALDRFTCVSAQYTDPNTHAALERECESVGLVKIGEDSAGGDLHEQAALFRAVDGVLTVQQTAVHVAGGVGARTHAVIGDKPHWRYGIEGDSLPFYSSVRLHRRGGAEWSGAIERAVNALDRELPRTKQAAA